MNCLRPPGGPDHPPQPIVLLSEKTGERICISTSHLQIIYNLNIARQRSARAKFQKNGASRGPENRKIRKIRNPENPSFSDDLDATRSQHRRNGLT